MTYIQRLITSHLLAAMENTPAIFLNGPRQVGKITLIKMIANNHLKDNYITFDDSTTFAAANHDPEGFIAGLEKPIIIDEVQMVPSTFRAIKKQIDVLRQKKKSPYGQFLLTGSANILALPELSDALVGRMELYTLLPLSVGEWQGKQETFLQQIFKEKIKFPKRIVENLSLSTLINKATFPELAAHPKINYYNWFRSYISTLLQRDVKSLAEIEKITALPNMLKLMAARAGNLLNDASLARDAGLNVMTYRRYRTLLIYIFLIFLSPPWFRNINKRLVKSPKIYITDTVLLCHLLDIDPKQLEQIKINKPNLFGMILENFVACELTKQLTWQNGTLYHFRTHDDQEIDFVIEKPNGHLIGIEVKSSHTISASDFKALKTLQSNTGADFIKGVILYLGEEIIPFGDKLFALPLSSLWNL